MNKILELTKKEFARQRDTLNLIASENYPSPKVLDILGTVWSNKYAIHINYSKTYKLH